MLASTSSNASPFGHHIHLGDTLFDSIVQYEHNCVQFYLGHQNSYHPKKLSLLDKLKTAQFLAKNPVQIYIHAPLVANLATDNADTSYSAVKQELELLPLFSGRCVLHIGKRGSNGTGTISNVAKHINQLGNLGLLKDRLLLENAAGQKNELGVTVEEIRHLIEATDFSTHLGLCLDTQHLFAGGVCDFQTHEKVVRMYEDFRDLAKIGLFHLNDSDRAYNSHVDRHAPLRQGYIWKQDISGLKSLVRICQDQGISMISETSDTSNDKEIIRGIIQADQ